MCPQLGWAGDGCLLHQFIGVTDRNRQIRAAKIIQNGEVHTDDLTFAIEKRSAGTSRSCCGVVNNFVLHDVSVMPLRGGWAHKVWRRQLRHNMTNLVRVLDYSA